MQTPEGPLRCRCVDISAGGMSVVSPRAARPRQRARIESSFGGQRLVFDAVVVRRRKSREGYVLGLRFEPLDPHARAHLEGLLRTMQLQAVLAQQASSFADRLPQLQLPEPETERMAAMQPPAPAQMPVPAPAQMPVPAPEARTGRTVRYDSPPFPVPAWAQPERSVEPTPPWDKTMLTPAPAFVPAPAGTPAPVPASTTMVVPVAPTPAGKTLSMPAMPASARTGKTLSMPAMPASTPTPAGTTMLMPTMPAPLEPIDWTDEELATAHYRATEEAAPVPVPQPPPPAPRLGPPTFELEIDLHLGDDADDDSDHHADHDDAWTEAPDDIDCTEVDATAGSITVAELELPEWEPGAPVSMAELVDTDPGARFGEPLAPASSARPELPRLSPDLQDALERVRRRDRPRLDEHRGKARGSGQGKGQ